jgi:hypothetical protein
MKMIPRSRLRWKMNMLTAAEQRYRNRRTERMGTSTVILGWPPIVAMTLQESVAVVGSVSTKSTHDGYGGPRAIAACIFGGRFCCDIVNVAEKLL